MPKIIDLAEVEAAMDDMRKRGAEAALRDGYDGAFARAQLAGIPAITIWRCNERNRGTESSDVTLALAHAVAFMLGSTVQENQPIDVDAQFELTNLILTAIGQKMAEVLLGQTGARQAIIVGKEANA